MRHLGYFPLAALQQFDFGCCQSAGSGRGTELPMSEAVEHVN